jgi:hypothetical protein
MQCLPIQWNLHPEPTPDILDLGRYIAYRGVVLKSLIDEFESLICR